MNINIRLWRMEDACALANVLNSKNIHDNLRDGLPLPYTVSDAEAFISTILAENPNTSYVRAITVDDTAIGCIGVSRRENIHRLTAEMGYYLAEAYWGRGIMTRAIKQMCRYIFDNTDIIRIFAEPFAHNIASLRALEKAGFVYEGTLQKNAIKNGQLVDTKMYALLRGGCGYG